jgi:hypothetical protein
LEKEAGAKNYSPPRNSFSLSVSLTKNIRREDVIKLKPPVIIGGDEIFGRVERQMPPNCPQCGAESVISIVYGLPMEMAPTPVEERDYVLSGCCIDLDSPGWYCEACGHKWRSE